MSRAHTPERDEQLLDIGRQCSDPLCHLVDFLPLKCQHCAQPFCADHFLPDKHTCPKYDKSQHDRIAPSCPLCNTPVAIPPGQDPNVRMERHLTQECEVMTGRVAVKKSPACARAKCGKVLVSPIVCPRCKHQFCPAHRFPNAHNCAHLVATAGAAPAEQAPGQQLSASSAAAMAAIKRSLANAKTSAASAAAAAKKAVPTPPSPTKEKAPAQQPKQASASSSRPLPFSATDRTPAPSAPSSTTDDAAATRCADDVPKLPWLFDTRPPPSIFGSA